MLGASTIPRRQWLRVVLAIAVVVAVVMLLAVASVFASGVRAEDANAGFGGGVVIHDEAGNVHVHPTG